MIYRIGDRWWTSFAFLGINPSGCLTGVEECVSFFTFFTRLLRNDHHFSHPHVISDMESPLLPGHTSTMETSVAVRWPIVVVIRFCGLPWSCGERDVEKFLYGISTVPGSDHFVRIAQKKGLVRRLCYRIMLMPLN